MPKSYELKLREAEERRRPQQKDEVYKALEGVSRKMLVAYDHPESVNIEMQLTWIQDDMKIEALFEHVYGEVLRLDCEFRRKPLRSLYLKKYVWYDKYVLRSRIHDVEMEAKDYGILNGHAVRISPYYESERLWGMPYPNERHREKTYEQQGPMEDPKLLIRLDNGPPNPPRTRLFLWTWLGASSEAYQPLVKALPKDWAVYVLELPQVVKRSRYDEAYPNSKFACEVMALTLAPVMAGGQNFFFAHSSGTHLCFYTTHMLKQMGIAPTACFFSSYFTPTSVVKYHSQNLDTLQMRQDMCIPIRFFCMLVKTGWGTDPRIGYMKYDGFKMYQEVATWPTAKATLGDWWLTKDMPHDNANQAMDCPLVFFYGKEDTNVTLQQVEAWSDLTTARGFEVKKMDGGHFWFVNSTKRSEILGSELAKLVKRFS